MAVTDTDSSRLNIKAADIITTNMFYILGQSGKGTAIIFTGLTDFSGIFVLAARFLAMIVAAIVISFLCWTLIVDYIYTNVINETTG